LAFVEKLKAAPIKKRDAKNSRLRQAAGMTHSRAVLGHRDGVSGGNGAKRRAFPALSRN
jgi:hypothetical protein